MTVYRPTLGFTQGSRAASWDNACVVTEVSTLLVITLVRSGLKKSYILKFMKYNYLHVKIVTSATVKILCDLRSHPLMANIYVWPRAVAVD